MPDDSPLDASIDKLAEHPQVAELAELVREQLLHVAAARAGNLAEGFAERIAASGLDVASADTPCGNPLLALQRPDETTDPHVFALVGWLLAQGAAAAPSDPAHDAELVTQLAWLSAHSRIGALGALEEIGGARAAELWLAAAHWLLGLEPAGGAAADRPSVLALVACLAVSRADEADAARTLLRQGLREPWLLRLLDGPPRPPQGEPSATAAAGPEPVPAVDAVERARLNERTVKGERVAPPLHPVALVLWAVTGVLLVRWLLRGLAWLVLRARRPTELRVDARAVVVRSRVELLGRTIRSSELVIPREGLLRAAHDVRYPRLAMYAGIIALALGTYVGVSLWVDGVRAASPSLLGLGIAVFGLGVAIDLAFSVLVPGRRGRSRVVLVPRKGRAIALATTDAEGATMALGLLRG